MSERLKHQDDSTLYPCTHVIKPVTDNKIKMIPYAHICHSRESADPGESRRSWNRSFAAVTEQVAGMIERATRWEAGRIRM